ncbi:outer membrane protein [Bdellovibrio svalbardensis]|uniref:Porin family protein n=1 Tax=Bdellovibrio svalbardensis TaxID=2972972 RepID=A0ABT6DJ69_9BACT|nr:outer membrane beta-barrel protein [Bdellovibrio svalbardensis]MDG0816816.1 porin family protein [Bdellovibrio svalbardensis]
MKRLSLFLVAALSLASLSANAMYTELGASYGYKTQTYDANNNNRTESLTGSISLYFWERIALELSYTDATAIVESKAYTADPKRTTKQQSQIMGADLIFILADKKALFQPYIKGGMAQIKRTQTIKIEGQDTYSNDPENAVAPSYGVGLKVSLTDSFGLKFSYDAWKTPVGNDTQTDDSAFRAGITWVL